MRKALRLKKIYQSSEFRQDFTYDGDDLGVRCSDTQTRFTLWSPLAKSVTLVLYRDGDFSPAFASIPMVKEDKGIWRYCTAESLHGIYYEYCIDHGRNTVTTGDPYARACGHNSKRCMVVDLSKTDPAGWSEDKSPDTPNEDIIYELHVKEFSWQQAGGFPEEYRGKYRAFTCGSTTLHRDGVHPTGLDYLQDLGITCIQLMPVYDFGSVDDESPTDFNWGYDPVYYNIPEGSYASDSHHGQVRIRQFKQMVQALHRHGFRVIMDVVYNHTYRLDSVFQQVVPWYYYRVDSRGLPSDGSCCGCDMASERPMCSKFILDSILYWAEEYHIDGFRFDLMGLLDVELMNGIRRALDERYGKGKKLLFGEPWAAGPTAMEKGSIPALKKNMALLDENVGMFCDDTRDSIKGHVFHANVPGFVTGAPELERKIIHSAMAWCVQNTGIKAPSQIVSYVSAHDNLTLWDKLAVTVPDEQERIRRNKLAAAIYMTCQGRLFLLSGEEFARTKDGLDNTYNESIALNRLDWERAYAFEDLRTYYQGLIALRKLCPGLCDKSSKAKDRFLHTWSKPGIVGYYLNNQGQASSWDTLCVIYNGNIDAAEQTLLPGNWEILADGDSSFLWQSPQLTSGVVRIPPLSALILGKKT